MSNVSSDHNETLDEAPRWGIPTIILGLIGAVAVQFVFVEFFKLIINSAPALRFFIQAHENAVRAGLYAIAQVLSLAVILVFISLKGNTLRSLGFRSLNMRKFWYVVPVFIVYAVSLTLTLILVNNLFPDLDLAKEQELGFVATHKLFDLIAIFLSIVIIPPLVEEALFRGFVFRGLQHKLHALAAALISSFLFALAHWQLNVGIDTFLLGLGACWLVGKTQSLWPAILLHGIKNGIAFYFLFIYV